LLLLNYYNFFKIKLKNEAELTNGPDSFLNRLKICLMVQVKYKEAFRNLRDALGGTQALSSFPSISSVQNVEQQQSSTNIARKFANRRNTLLSADNRSHGILMSEEDVIFEHIDVFSKRVNCLIEQIASLSQFQELLKNSAGLAKPKKEDFGLR
jgi:hypothetical protein